MGVSRLDASAPWALGYSASHNGAACLLKGEEIIVAIQEERLSGEKRARITDPTSSLAISYCLKTAGIEADDLSAIVGAHFSGQQLADCTFWPAGWPGIFEIIPHHYAHAVAAFATSGFNDAAVLIIDGQGGFESHLPAGECARVIRSGVPGLKRSSEIISIYKAEGRSLSCVEKHLGDWIPESDRLTAQYGMQSFGSLGGMYAAAAHAIFGDAMDSGKVMGLSAMGAPQFPVESFFKIRADGGFDFSDDATPSYSSPERWPARRDAYVALAASVQAAVEAGVLAMARRTRAVVGSPRLCYTGGVALNAVANERMIREKIFDSVYLQPAAEDSGTAIGAAFHGLWRLLEKRGSARDAPKQAVHDSCGRRYAPNEIEDALARTPGIEVVARDAIIDRTVGLLTGGAVVGWFDGGAELGPRALGHRSLLCDPRPPDAKEKMNLKVKHREPFRPFAPIVLEEKAAEWFDVPAHDPFSPVMLRVFPFHEDRKAAVHAVVHYDGTGRLQSLRRSTHPRLYELVEKFDRATGVPIILNTSFNVMGEPIIETPDDALWSLLYTAIDVCVFENLIVRRAPSFTSMLDLKPSLNVRSLQVETLFDDHDGRGSKATAQRYWGEALTPWGVKRSVLHPTTFAFLSKMDGRATGRAIMNALAPTTGLEEKSTLALLHMLRRRGFIKLS